MHTEGEFTRSNPFADAASCDPPPPYPNTPSLSLLLNDQSLEPQTLLMRGEARSPDFTVLSETQQPIYKIETDSTLVYHESSIYSISRNHKLFDMKRKVTDERYMYTAQSGWNSSTSVKLFELETSPRSLGQSDPTKKTRLIFRNALTGELDAIDLQVNSSPDEHSSLSLLSVRFEAVVLHHDVEIGSMKNIGSSRSPEYQLTLGTQGIDPLLFVVLALAVDDRSMTTRRRRRRPMSSGWTGIGKGPGVGLAGAYALGGISF